ncbi:uncharacterized protein LOC113501674 [Trichoplusia ni]|uniref:Uncharacterized protein LOC113501674 n=1 Tax=Trichoplusia ni TaxID=7111 RepID=A0A7E5WD70_TRINI|nr:uncharacterized protein LOC113501674 [Trichoplusia ni]
MSSTLKCSVCNIVIDELLSYIQNKISVIDEITLMRICTTSFSSEEIQKSKSLLFDSLSTDVRKISRKRKGKEVRDLEDIISLFKVTDPDAIPIFVARQLEKLPPITFDHLDCTKLLKDLLLVKEEIEQVKTTYASVKQLEDLRNEVIGLKNDRIMYTPAQYINNKSGAWFDNNEANAINDSTIEVNSVCDKLQKEELVANSKLQNNSNCRYPKISDKEIVNCVNEEPSVVVTHRDMQKSPRTPPPLAPVTENKTKQQKDDQLTVLITSAPVSPNAAESECESRNNTEWRTISYKKRSNYRYAGKAGTARDVQGSFKAAERKVPIFISNVHKDTMAKDIVSYIQSKTQDVVSLEKINTKKQKEHNAYKFFVSESKLSLFLDENIWPEGIIFRRFVHFKSKYVRDMSTKTATNQTYNA